jgi:hypothetical protein
MYSVLRAEDPGPHCVGDPLTGDRFALVLGNSDYGPSEQVSGVKDAKDMACDLKQLGFDVDWFADAHIGEMQAALELFAKKIANPKVKVVLFYFSGHGFQQDGENYLVPKAASYKLAGLLKLKDVLDVFSVNQQPDVVKIIILDSCRGVESVLVDGKKPAVPGLAKVQNETSQNVVIGFATIYNRTAAAGSPKENSPYTAALLAHLREAGLLLTDLFDKVWGEVAHAPNSDQIPWQEGDIPKGFALRPAVQVKAVIESADDDLVLALHQQDVLTLGGKPSAAGALVLGAGSNPVQIRVYNARTYRNHHSWESPEGWNYELTLSDLDGHPLKGNPLDGGRGRFADKEPVVYKDGPHHGKWFTVASADLFVDPKTGALTLRDKDTKVWKSEGAPYQLDQALLCKKVLLRYNPGLLGLPAGAHEVQLLVGGRRDLSEKVRACLARKTIPLGMGWRFLAEVAKGPRGNPEAVLQELTPSGTPCERDHLWFAVEDRSGEQIGEVPSCG